MNTSLFSLKLAVLSIENKVEMIVRIEKIIIYLKYGGRISFLLFLIYEMAVEKMRRVKTI